MKTFILIFTFALIACLMLAQGAPVDEATDGPLANDIPIAGNVPQADNVLQENDKVPQATEDHSEVAVLPPVKAIANRPSTLGKPSKQCKAIGSLCTLSDDCCSFRCSSYHARCSS